MPTISLTWVDTNDHETGHRVYRDSAPIDPEAPPPPVAELGPDATEYSDEVAAGTHHYRVAAVGPLGEQMSDEVVVTVGTDKLSLGHPDELDPPDDLLLEGDAQTGGDRLTL